MSSVLLLGKNKNYDFYLVDVADLDKNSLKKIVQRCEAVENSVWSAQSKFVNYLKKHTHLIYAEDRGSKEMGGFLLINIRLVGKTLFVYSNECMVNPNHQGQSFPALLSSILTLHIRRKYMRTGFKKLYKSVVFISLTVNYKVMHIFKRYSWLIKTSSFDPCQKVVTIAQDYLQEEGLESLSEDYPFAIKAAFPGSLKEEPLAPKPSFLPPEFQFQRGDGFLYVGQLTQTWLFALLSQYIRFRSGFRFQASAP